VTLLYDVKVDGRPEVGKTLLIIRTKAGADSTPLVSTKVKVAASRKLPTVKESRQKGQKQALIKHRCKLSVTDYCFECGRPFRHKREDAMFCSGKCRIKAMRENRQLRMI
jgi:hypothetical protein